jgi:alkylhydroperoxidase family enzyme
MLDAWRESSLYSDRERAGLAWTEALTRVYETGAPDEAYEALKLISAEEERIKITLVIGAINAFHRVNVGFRIRRPASVGRKAA